MEVVNNEEQFLYYEVCFRCSVDIYKATKTHTPGDMVSVPCERGYTIGFVSREVYGDELMYKFSSPNWKPKKIHTHLLDEDGSIRQTLRTKIDTENFALSHCKVLMRGHRSGSLAEVLATEFQYDNKRLTVYLKKYEDLSVCRLVRKLNEKFRTRISVIEVESSHEIEERARRYLALSQLNISIDRMSNASNEKNSQNFLLMKYQQLNGISAPLVSCEDKVAQEYQHYGPFNHRKVKLTILSDESSSSSISSTSSSFIYHSSPGSGLTHHTVQDLFSTSGIFEHDVMDSYSAQYNHSIDNLVTDDWHESENPHLVPNVTKYVNPDGQYPHCHQE